MTATEKKPTLQASAFTLQDTNLLKGLAVGMMLFHHLFTYDYRLAAGVGYLSLGSYYGSKYETILGAFCQLCVALFLALGGYGTWLSWVRAENRRAKWCQKILRLYSGFWKVFAVFIPIAILLHDPMVVPVTLRGLLGNFFAFDLTYNGEWWFLTPYLLLTAAFPLIYRWLRQKRVPGWVEAAFVVAAQLAVCKALPQAMRYVPAFANTLLWQQLYAALRWAGPFLMGCLAARDNWFARAQGLVQNRPLRYACCAAVLAAVFFARAFGGMGDTLDCLYAPLFLAAAGAILRDIPLLRGALALLGRYSMPIWLVHSFYCYHFCQAFVYCLRWPALIFVQLALMSLATAWLLEKVCTVLGKGLRRILPAQEKSAS
ncbi:MAG: acyltransferase [Faecalibacterium sp.]|jgi:hypothetical protein|nr:acyltransferase [Faecalibacterium sp.]